MAKTDLGGMGWILIFIAGYAILQKKGVAQGAAAPLTQQQISQANWLPSTPNVGSNSYVAWIQTTLNRVIGAGLAVDGILGPATRAAVMQFQGIWQIPQTGIVDAETDYDLHAALGESPYINQPFSVSGTMPLIVAGEY